MADFTYTGVDREGKRASGKLSAASEGEVRMLLRTQGIRPRTINQGTQAGQTKVNMLGQKKKKGPSGGTKVPIALIVLFTRQLQLLISSGIPLVQAMEILSEQSESIALKNVLMSIRAKVSEGSYLWESMSAYPRVFPGLYLALIRAGESSGSMDNMLRRLAKYLEDEDRLKKMIKGAMMYPIIVVCIGILVVGLMLIFVIPKFEAMLKTAGQDLPGPTQLIIYLSHFLQQNFLFIAGGVYGIFFLLKRYISTAEGRMVKDEIMFKMPVFGQLAQKSGIARFARTLQTLLTSGVNLIDAIEICKKAADNAVIENAVGKIRAEVESGKTLGMILMKMDVFPKMASQMISVGESTGNLDKSLEKIADFYESDVEILVGGMTKMMEPIILVLLGGTIGGIMIAMYLPIFKMAGGA